jgi:hypothetical protein
VLRSDVERIRVLVQRKHVKSGADWREVTFFLKVVFGCLADTQRTQRARQKQPMSLLERALLEGRLAVAMALLSGEAGLDTADAGTKVRLGCVRTRDDLW